MSVVETRRTQRPRARRAEEQARSRRATEIVREVAVDDWNRPRWGDEVVTEVLDALAPDAWVVRGLTIPVTEVGIDHLVIAPTGVWLVVICDAPGPLGVGDGMVWDRRRPMREELATVEWMAGEIAVRLDQEVRPIMCCTRAPLPEPAHLMGPVHVANPQVLSKLIMRGPSNHERDEVDWMASVAEALLSTPSTAPASTDADDEPSDGSSDASAGLSGSSASDSDSLDPENADRAADVPIVLEDPPPVVLGEEPPEGDEDSDEHASQDRVSNTPTVVLRIPAAEVLDARPAGSVRPKRVHARHVVRPGSRLARFVGIAAIVGAVVAAIWSIVSELQ